MVRIGIFWYSEVLWGDNQRRRCQIINLGLYLKISGELGKVQLGGMFACHALSMGFDGGKEKVRRISLKLCLLLPTQQLPSAHQVPGPIYQRKRSRRKDEQQIWTRDFEYKPIILHKSEDFIYSGILYPGKLSHPSKQNKKDVKLCFVTRQFGKV